MLSRLSWFHCCRHGEEQERLDLGRYNLQQIHDLMAAKGFKRSLTSSWSYDDFSLPAGPFRGKEPKKYKGEIRTCSG